MLTSCCKICDRDRSTIWAWGPPRPGEVVVRHGVKLIGTLNLPSGMPLHASQMYARNIQAVLEHLVVEGSVALDFDDEITADAVITHEGRVTSRLLQEATA